MTTAALAGSTGLVGSHILSTLLSNPSISSVHAFTRRDLPTSSPKLHPLQSAETNTWPSLYPRSPPATLFLSALGTTRAAAGSLAAQRKIDFDLNLDLAKAAKEAGCQTYVLISSGGANPHSSFGYPKMKGELEEEVKKLGFKHTVILRPGLIMGERQETRVAEGIVRKLAGGLRGVFGGAATDWWAQGADEIARAAVKAGIECESGKRDKGVWVIGQAEIVEWGRERK